MKQFYVMLEGKDDEINYGYLVTITVVSESKQEAIDLALTEAGRRGMDIIGVEEIERATTPTESDQPGVTHVSGRSWFEPEL